MSAVQNLKSRWPAVTTPMTPAATPPSMPQQVAVRPTTHCTPLRNAGPNVVLSTPNNKSITPIKGRLGALTPQKTCKSMPYSASMMKGPTGFSTPRTPNSSLSSVFIIMYSKSDYVLKRLHRCAGDTPLNLIVERCH